MSITSSSTTSLFIWMALLAVSLPVMAGEPTVGDGPPDDPLWNRQMSFHNPGGVLEFDISTRRPSLRRFDSIQGIDLNILPAWRVTTGSPEVVVAVIDDGFFYDHEDLRENIWRNAGEMGVDEHGCAKETNGVDDDGNGYADDVVGWDFAFDDPDPDCYAFAGMDPTTIEPYTHGNPSLGIIGARGDNGIGIAGINWQVSLMVLRDGAQGTPRNGIDTRRIERAAAAIRYAADNGARIISWSQFISDYRPERLAILQDAIDYAEQKDVLIVVAAGNSIHDIDEPENAFYPACYANENIMVVAEIDFEGKLDYTVEGRWKSGSSFGVRNTDIGAIGRNYATNVYHGRSVYSIGGGTSHATPVVAGVAALCLAVNPDLSALQLKQILMDSATPLPALKGKVACGGMVNAGAAVERAQHLLGAK